MGLTTRQIFDKFSKESVSFLTSGGGELVARTVRSDGVKDMKLWILCTNLVKDRSSLGPMPHPCVKSIVCGPYIGFSFWVLRHLI